MTSVILNNPDVELFFHIFTAGLPQEEIERFSMLAEEHGCGLGLYLLNEKAFGLNETGRGRRFHQGESPFAYLYRLFAPNILKGTVSRFLYLDSDILCIGRLEELVNTDIGENILLVAPAKAGLAEEKCQKFALRKYFNSGMLFVDVDRWCAEEISEKAIGLLNEKSFDATLPDQDALNVLLADRAAGFVDTKWNSRCDLSRPGASIPPDAVLVHFVSTNKPWMKSCDDPLNRHFLRYAERSPWTGMPMADPDCYREMRRYAKILIKRGKLFSAAHWQCRSIVKRIQEKAPANQVWYLGR